MRRPWVITALAGALVSSALAAIPFAAGAESAPFAPLGATGMGRADSSWRVVVATDGHTCGIQTDASLWCWGRGDRGDIGNGVADGIFTSPQHIGSSNWASVSGNNFYSCGIHADRGLYCWGSGSSIGHGSYHDALRPLCSAILPAWARKSPQVGEVLPLLYLHGLSSGDFVPALEQFLGSAAGLSASTITRPTTQWQDDAEAFSKRSLTGTDYVYCWVDGIHLKVRLEQDKVCLLVILGVRADGTKELVALADGFRESSESWADLLRSCKRRGMRAPVLAVGDGALGFWKAIREVFPETKEQRCWFHVTGNVLAALPKSAHPGAKAALAEIYNAEDREHAHKAAKAFEADYGAKWPKAVTKITDHLDVLLTFYDFPAEHWIHLRTTNPIESTFATVRLRQRVTKGPGSRAAGVAMAFKLIESAQARWRAVNAPHLVALVRAGAVFDSGLLVERPEESGGDQQVA